MAKLKPACEVFKLPKFKKASEVLVAARKILKNRNRWCQQTEAWGYGDVELEADAAEAVKFCAIGAVRFVGGPAEEKATDFLWEVARGFKTNPNNNRNQNIFEVNDDLGYKKTIEMFNRAIKLAKAAEK